MSRYHSKRLEQPERYSCLAQAILDTHINYGARCRNVVDLGCSCGVLLKPMEHVTDWRLGIDHSTNAQKLWCCDDSAFMLWDFDKEGAASDFGTTVDKFDTIVSFECAEHLEAPDTLFETTSNLASDDALFFFSGAIPGQRGKGHISCKPIHAWRDLIEFFGWAYDHHLTAQFFRNIGWHSHHFGKEDAVPSFYDNAMVFRRVPTLNQKYEWYNEGDIPAFWASKGYHRHPNCPHVVGPDDAYWGIGYHCECGYERPA